MGDKNILCSISTRGRYWTTLPLAIQSVICQTLRPDHLTIFDDNDSPVDLRENQTYLYLFQMLDLSGITWDVVFAEKKGQHYNHQRANKMGFKWVWRLDDDTVAEPNVLAELYKYASTNKNVGAVGGAVLTPPVPNHYPSTGKIQDIYNEPNIQWAPIQSVKHVDHLHCSFLYRAGIVDYNLGLSKVAHREETLFTYCLRVKGYDVAVVPNAITWHMRNKEGGIRDGQQDMFARDEAIFKNTLDAWQSNKTIVVLNNGMGDHIVFKRILKDLKNPVVFSCYNDIVPGRSIAEAEMLFGSLEPWDIYRKMEEWNWTESLEKAYRKMYGLE